MGYVNLFRRLLCLRRILKRTRSHPRHERIRRRHHYRSAIRFPTLCRACYHYLGDSHRVRVFGVAAVYNNDVLRAP